MSETGNEDADRIVLGRDVVEMHFDGHECVVVPPSGEDEYARQITLLQGELDKRMSAHRLEVEKALGGDPTAPAWYLDENGVCEAATISNPSGEVVCLSLNFGPEHLEFYRSDQRSSEPPGHSVRFSQGGPPLFYRTLSDQQVLALKQWCEGALATR